MSFYLTTTTDYFKKKKVEHYVLEEFHLWKKKLEIYFTEKICRKAPLYFNLSMIAFLFNSCLPGDHYIINEVGFTRLIQKLYKITSFHCIGYHLTFCCLSFYLVFISLYVSIHTHSVTDLIFMTSSLFFRDLILVMAKVPTSVHVLCLLLILQNGCVLMQLV